MARMVATAGPANSHAPDRYEVSGEWLPSADSIRESLLAIARTSMNAAMVGPDVVNVYQPNNSQREDTLLLTFRVADYQPADPKRLVRSTGGALVQLADGDRAIDKICTVYRRVDAILARLAAMGIKGGHVHGKLTEVQNRWFDAIHLNVP